MLRAVLCVALVLVAVGCGNGDEPERWAGPPHEAPNGTLAVDGFNHHLSESDEPFVRSPLLAAAEFLRLDRTVATETSLVTHAGPEGAGPTTVVVTLNGLLDDSIRTKRYELVFTANGDTLRLRQARWSQRCQPGRGHQDFSAELCL